MIKTLTILTLLTTIALGSPYGIILNPETSSLPPDISSFRTTASEKNLTSLLSKKTNPNTTITATLQQPNIADKTSWKSLTSNTIAKFHPTISQWDILPSYNLLPRQSATPYLYVELLTIAHQNANQLSPPPKIGFNIANYDLEFLDSALRDGAAGNFDYISLSPFPVQKNSSPQFLTVLPTIKALLKSHKLENIPVTISLTGTQEDINAIAPIALKAGFHSVFLDANPKNIPNETPTTPEPSFTGNQSVSIQLGETNLPDGIYQLIPSTTAWDPETNANRLRVTANPPQTQSDFLVHPSFISPDTREIEITITAKRIDSPDGLQNTTGINLIYEAIHGPKPSKTFWSLPGENKWHSFTWKISDAAFKSKLGWNIRIDASGVGNDVLIKDITVKR